MRRVIGRSIRILVLLCVLATIPSVSGAPLLGDGDADGDIDLGDFAGLQNCFSPLSPFGAPECAAFDYQPPTTILANDYRRFLCGFEGPGIVVQPITVVPPPAVVNQVDLALFGTTAGATHVIVTGGLQQVTVPLLTCNWQAFIQIAPNVVSSISVVGAYYGQTLPSPPVTFAVANDLQPPSVFIDFPAAGAEITTATTDVAGRVSDVLSGFMGLGVTVNGLPADVNIGVGTNGTFFLPAVPLELGENIITAVATDAQGNMAETQITVTRVEIPPDAATITVVSGNGQSAVVHFPLAEPIVVRVANLQGMPIEGKLVNFHVTRSDGRLAADAPPAPDGGTMMLQVFSDANGQAKAFWRLGTDAGMGNNRVEVMSTDVVGTTIFCASALAGAPLKLNIGTGNHQRGEAGGPATEPLVVWANDACNPNANVPVTFTVAAGGGKVNGQDEVIVPTSATGHAGVNFTYGPDTGNNSIVATFAGNPTTQARFVLHGVKRDLVLPTTLSGIVLDNGEQPLRNATCTLTFGGSSTPCPDECVVMTDIDGKFEFTDLPSTGPARLLVDGATADHVGGSMGMDVPANSYPAVPFKLVIVPNAANALPSPVRLPRLNPANQRSYSTTQDTELTIEGIAGLKMIVKAGSMALEQNGTLVPAPDGTPITLNQVHHDDVPMPMTDGAAPPFAWTLKPAGAHFNPPIKVEYPNMSGLPAGAIANFLSFNHDLGKFQIVASGSVSEDGMKIVTDPGSGLTIAGWGCNCPPYSVTGQCCHSEGPEGGGFDCCVDPCPPCSECIDGSCAPIICIECSTCVNGQCVSDCGPCETCGENGMCVPCAASCMSCLFGSCIGACGACETCQDGECVPCDQCQICVNGVCISLGTDCGTGCCPAGMVCCQVEGVGHACLPAGSQCCEVQGHASACQPPNSVCCSPGGCAPDGHVCCEDGVHQCASAEQCCSGGPCCQPGEVCCSGHCYSEGTQCCTGTTCVDPGGTSTHCCQDPTPVCCGTGCIASGDGCCADGGGFCDNGVCCSDGCQPQGSTCCPNGVVCEPPNSECCGSGCWAPGLCCNGQPLGQSQQCCADVGFGAHVCNSNQTCCAAGCCPPGTNCCDGLCVVEDAACCPLGGSCPVGQECCGSLCFSPATHNCCSPSSNGICPLSAPVCCPPGGTLTYCCAPNAQCCGDTCCASSQTCCIGPNGSDCCNPGQTCNNGVCQ